MARFEPHGAAKVSVRGRVLWVHPEGPGNLEEIDRLIGVIEAALSTLSPGRWAALLVAEAVTLLTPEAESALIAALPKLIESGHVALAVAMLNPSIRTLTQAQFGRVYATQNLPFAVFDTTEAAEAWLTAQLQRAHET